MIDRYSRPEMARIWTLENKFQRWLKVELLACEAWAELGVLPKDEIAALRKQAAKVQIDAEFVARVDWLDRNQTRHDVVAFTTALAERIGPLARHIHYGLTSTDLVDTALSSLIVEAIDQIDKGIERLIGSVRRRAVEFKDTLMIGRTHGIHAEPTTFGLKLALWSEELKRDRERLKHARDNLRVGKLSGAVGTYANIDPFVEQYVCKKMGLKPAPISTQVLQRDRHAELGTTLAILGGTLEKMALEVRLLQKTETREVEEPFSEGQKGSSAMPHKRNPVTCEQICGLARILRGNALASLEDIALWHERDISHSSVERIVLPDSTLLADYLLEKMAWVIENMRVYPQNMLRSLNATGGLIFSQRLLLALVGKGLAREAAYKIVQGHAMAGWDSGVPFRQLIEADPTVRDRLSAAELDACFDASHHLRHVNTIFRRLELI